MANEITFEQIDAQIKKVDLSKYKPGGANYFTSAEVSAQPAGVLQKICELYHSIRGILVAISNFPLLPISWKAVIKTFIDLLDGICPTT